MARSAGGFGAFATGLIGGYTQMRENVERNEIIEARRRERERAEALERGDVRSLELLEGAAPMEEATSAIPEPSQPPVVSGPGTDISVSEATPAGKPSDFYNAGESAGMKAETPGMTPLSPESVLNEISTLEGHAFGIQPTEAIGPRMQPTMAGYSLYTQKLIQIAKEEGLGADWVIDQSGKFSKLLTQGFVENASKAIVSLQMGNGAAAARLLEHANGFLANGVRIKAVPTEGNKLRITMHNERTGEVAGKPMTVGVEEITNMIGNMGDPVKNLQNSKAMELLDKQIEEAGLKVEGLEYEQAPEQRDLERRAAEAGIKGTEAETRYRTAYAKWIEGGGKNQAGGRKLTDLDKAIELVENELDAVMTDLNFPVEPTEGTKRTLVNEAADLMLETNLMPQDALSALALAERDSSKVQLITIDGKEMGIVPSFSAKPIPLPDRLVKKIKEARAVRKAAKDTADDIDARIAEGKRRLEELTRKSSEDPARALMY